MILREFPDAPEPHAALAALIRRPGPFLIESNALGGDRRGRSSFAGADPSRIVAEAGDNALEELSAGWAGYVLRTPAPDPASGPAVEIRVYDPMVTWDHDRGAALVTGRDPAARERADRLWTALVTAAVPRAGPPRPRSPLRSDLGRREFMDAVSRAAGAGRSSVALNFEVRLSEAPLAVYLRFRKTLSAPVTAFFGGPDGDVIASSSGAGAPSPDARSCTFGIRSTEGERLIFPVVRALIHRDGVYRFRTEASIDRRSDPADVYARAMAAARPLAAVLGFRL